jgi:branched-chain amino acid transport system ATP-binding protein
MGQSEVGMSALLELDAVTRTFRGLRAVDGVSLSIAEGEIVGLIGPNGAGKTTLVNVVTGVHQASAGRVRFRGEDITRLQPNRVARRGIGRTFQVVQPFPRMTVAENIAAGAMFAGGARSLAQATARARELAERVGLGDVVDRSADTLTLARRKRLELAKGLAMAPKLLFLDEVNAGLNTAEIDEALALIRSIAAEGVTIVVIEHLMKVVLSISTRIVVLHHGQLIADGAPDAVMRDRAVAEAYLGKRYAATLAEGAP